MPFFFPIKRKLASNFNNLSPLGSNLYITNRPFGWFPSKKWWLWYRQHRTPNKGSNLDITKIEQCKTSPTLAAKGLILQMCFALWGPKQELLFCWWSWWWFRLCPLTLARGRVHPGLVGNPWQGTHTVYKKKKFTSMSNLDSSKDLNGKTPECWKKHTQKKTNKTTGQTCKRHTRKTEKGGKPPKFATVLIGCSTVMMNWNKCIQVLQFEFLFDSSYYHKWQPFSCATVITLFVTLNLQ